MTTITKLSQRDQAAILRWPEVFDIGIIRAETQVKEVHVNGWQHIDFSKVNFRINLASGEYDEGIAVRTGKTISGKYYLIVLDFDGWDSIIAWFGSWDNVLALSKRTLVEWHNDTGSIHVFLLSAEPIISRRIRINADSQLEVRCVNEERTGTLVYVSPSIHKSGKPYAALGVDTIESMQDIDLLRIKSKIDRLSDDYMSDVDKNAYDTMLEQPDIILGIHGGRHDATKFKIIRYYWKYSGDWLNLTDDQRFERAWDWHLAHCKPPRDRREFDQICKWVTRTMQQKRDALHDKVREQQQQQRASASSSSTSTSSKSNGTGTGKGQGQQEKEKNRYEYVQKYSNDDLLAEAVIIGNRPRFAVIRPMGAAGITLEKEIPLNDEKRTVFKPLDPESYINKPYVFKSEEQFYDYVDRAIGENLDTLYSKVKTIWQKYIDADDFHISLCAADTIFTYYQDAIGMTHYLFFVGDNDSGKSNNLVIFHEIGYRNLMSVGVSVANIYQFLGSRDEGVGTICEDEANNIEDDHDKMEVAKSGYTKGYPVIRTIITAGGRFQLKYCTFCFKAYSAEKAPDSVKAKGLTQRLIKLRCTAGVPDYDILEVVNHAGDDLLKALYDELGDIRNVLLCHRILHHYDKIPNIRLNLKNREKQLFKPVLRLFQGTETFDKLCLVMSRYVNERRKSKTRSPNAFLCKVVKDLIHEKDTLELESSDIWTRVQVNTTGISVPGHPLSYDTVEFGILSQKGVTETLVDILKADYSNAHGHRKLIFDRENLDNVRSVYTDAEVKIKLESESDSSEEVGSGADGADGAHVGGVRGNAHPNDDDTENAKEKEENKENHHESDVNNENNETVGEGTDTPLHPHDPHQAHHAHPSPPKEGAGQ